MLYLKFKITLKPFSPSLHDVHQWHILPTDRRSCDGRITFLNSWRNLHAGYRNNRFNNNQPPTKSLGSPCPWCLLYYTKIQPTRLFQHINSLYPKTKFTMETEENSVLSFLDTLIQRNSNNTISVRVYRKPTHTDQYLKFTSHHLARAKKSVITSLFDRAKNIISNPSDQEKDENHLTAVLQANDYPKKFINNTIRSSQLPRQSANNDNTKNQEQIAPVRINFPYMNGPSKQLKRIFNDHINISYPVPSEQRNNIVYKYDCKDCEAVYFGESNWENKKIMDYEANTTRKIKETIHSFSNNNHINEISYRLTHIWFPVLKTKGGSEVSTSSNQNEETNKQSQASTVSTQVRHQCI